MSLLASAHSSFSSTLFLVWCFFVIPFTAVFLLDDHPVTSLLLQPPLLTKTTKTTTTTNNNCNAIMSSLSSSNNKNNKMLKASTSTVSTTSEDEVRISENYCCQDNGVDASLLSVLRRAFPNIHSYKIHETIVQSNAIGYKLTVLQPGDDNADDNNSGDVDVFLKLVQAAEYVSAKKDWTDLRRTLLYARTEGRFYSQMVPLLASKKGFKATPKVYVADYELSGWIDEDEKSTSPADPSINKDALPDADKKGGVLILECVSDETHYQDSPLSVEQSKQCLEGVAELHAAAWQDEELLTAAESKLSRASFHLKMRNPKELASIVDTWGNFCAAFDGCLDDAGLKTPSILRLGERVEKLAEYVSHQVSPSPTDRYATIIHGDFKSMNAFLPKRDGEKTLLVDFASCGVGLAMSDLAMHIRHAVKPEDLGNGGEEAIVKHYWEYLTERIGGSEKYPWEEAWRHYKLAVVDYFRFFSARMWKSATPETIAKKADNKNINLINRSVPAAMAFLKNVDQYVTEIEEEYETVKSM